MVNGREQGPNPMQSIADGYGTREGAWKTFSRAATKVLPSSAHFNRLAVRAGGFSTGLHYLLRFQGHFRPQWVKRPGFDLVGEVAEEPAFLGGRMAMAVLSHPPAAVVGLHFEIATLNREHRVAGLEGDLASRERQDKILQPKITARAAHMSPLLGFGNERTVEAAGDPVRVKDFAREFGRHR